MRVNTVKLLLSRSFTSNELRLRQKEKIEFVSRNRIFRIRLCDFRLTTRRTTIVTNSPKIKKKKIIEELRLCSLGVQQYLYFFSCGMQQVFSISAYGFKVFKV